MSWKNGLVVRLKAGQEVQILVSTMCIKNLCFFHVHFQLIGIKQSGIQQDLQVEMLTMWTFAV